MARRKRLPLLLACIVLALLILAPALAYFWIRWDHAWLVPDTAWTVIAVRYDGVEGDSPQYTNSCTAAFLAAGTMSAFEDVKCRRGFRLWPRTYGWTQIRVPWKPIHEMDRLLPEFKDNLNWELSDIGEHIRYRIAVVDPSGAVSYPR